MVLIQLLHLDIQTKSLKEPLKNPFVPNSAPSTEKINVKFLSGSRHSVHSYKKKKTGSSRVLSSHWIIERSRLSKKPHKAYLVLRLWKGSVWIPTPNCFPIRRRPSRNVWILHCKIKGSQLLKMFLLEGFYKEPLRVLPEGQVKNPFECTCLVHLV